MKNNVFIVDESGVRLDKYLADKIEKLSRSQIQKYIKNGDITVNGIHKAVKYLLNLGDKIHINISEITSEQTIIKSQKIPLDIIFEDENIIVINKAAGITVHPGTGNIDGTLANALAYHCDELSDNNGLVRPGIVHRLDQDTSGIIVAAKTNYAHMKIAEQFANRLVKKVYFGITWGTWKAKEGLIDQPIDRKRNDPTSFIVNALGKESQTDYTVQKETQYFSFMNYFPRTGRTHQIRVHSAFLGNPIIGDIKYGGGLSRGKGYIPEITKKLKILYNSVQRHMLHAKKITFMHPIDDRTISFEAELPGDMQNVISKIELLDV